MRNLQNLVNKIIENKNAPKYIIGTFLGIVLLIIVFLTVSLVKYYNNNVKSHIDGSLVYVFEPNTISYNSNDIDEDISEEFLSYGVSYGVDVSEWQGEINWEKVAKTGISFAMIRCGFRQTDGSEIIEDARFKDNIEGAIKSGLKVGVYFYGAAKTTEEAIEEAEFTINLIKDYNLTYPVVYDMESFDKGRLKTTDYSAITDNILTYTETIGSYGYESMVYSYYNAFKNKLDTGKLDGKLIWLAHYVDSTDYNGNYNMWQYTDSGTVDGIKTNVDLNISYFTYVSSQDEITKNPNETSVVEPEFTKVEEEVKIKSEAVYRSSASSSVPNKLGTLKKGEKLVRTGISSEFSKVLYNGRIVYIENEYLTVSN